MKKEILGPCNGCGEETDGRLSEIKKDYVFCCPRCLALRLSKMFLEEDDNDTLKDISENEQIASWLIDIAK